jgi:hypothetical protein
MDHQVQGAEESEPRARTLILFGVLLVVMIVSIIVGAAILGA